MGSFRLFSFWRRAICEVTIFSITWKSCLLTHSCPKARKCLSDSFHPTLTFIASLATSYVITAFQLRICVSKVWLGCLIKYDSEYRAGKKISWNKNAIFCRCLSSDQNDTLKTRPQPQIKYILCKSKPFIFHVIRVITWSWMDLDPKLCNSLQSLLFACTASAVIIHAPYAKSCLQFT